jgi:uncharacterized protein (DUF433 family)
MVSTSAIDRDALALYGGRDPRELPRYSYPEAARATGVPASTVSAWVRGQKYSRKQGDGFFHPVIRLPDEHDSRLSFFNLIEIHNLRSLRGFPHRVKLSKVREALDVAEKQFGIDRLLIHEELRVGAGKLFLDRLSSLEELSRSAQLVMRELLVAGLKQVDFSKSIPTRFWPRERVATESHRLILVSPEVSFGRPVVGRLGVSTFGIASRINSGETPDAVRQDLGLTQDELNEALALEEFAVAA